MNSHWRYRAWDEGPRHWAIVAALHATGVAGEDDVVTPAVWRGLFQTLLPIASSSAASGKNVHNTLILLAEGDARGLRELVGVIAAHSGRTWLQVLEDKMFARFFQILKVKGFAPARVGGPLLCSAAGARHLGIIVFDKCELQELDEAVVQTEPLRRWSCCCSRPSVA